MGSGARRGKAGGWVRQGQHAVGTSGCVGGRGKQGKGGENSVKTMATMKPGCQLKNIFFIENQTFLLLLLLMLNPYI